MLSEMWRCKRKGKKNHNSDIQSSNAPPVSTDGVVTSCLKPRPAFPQLSSEARRWWRMEKYCKSGPWGLSPHCWGAQTGAGCPRWGHHAGWFLPVEEQNDLSQTYLLSTGCSACFTQKLLRRLCWGEGSLPSHRQDPGLTPGGWGTAALVTGTGHAGVTARPFLSQHLSATNEFSPKSA